MSYDLFLYPSARGVPDTDEAMALLETDGGEPTEPLDDSAVALIDKIVSALLSIDPKLERFGRADGSVELTSPDGDRSPLQISVSADGVGVSIASGHPPKRARRIFARFDRFARAIHEVAGYFVFDPQCEHAWDPTQRGADPDAVYVPMQPVIDRGLAAHIAARPAPTAPPVVPEVAPPGAKPWWKFW